MTMVGDGEYEAELVAKVGPLKAAFAAAISLRDVTPLESYRLEVQVKGGVAGFANGAAAVRLEEVDDGRATMLRYRIEGAIGGKLAQLGSRLVEGAARSMTARFFARFAADFDGAAREGGPIEGPDTKDH